jgi:hypothetical protein
MNSILITSNVGIVALVLTQLAMMQKQTRMRYSHEFKTYVVEVHLLAPEVLRSMLPDYTGNQAKVYQGEYLCPWAASSEQEKQMGSPHLLFVTITLENGITWGTSVNRAMKDEEIVEYFFGKQFHYSSDEDKVSKCVRVVIDRSL